MFRDIADAILCSSVERHELFAWYNNLTDKQKSEIVDGLANQIELIIGSHGEQLDQFAATAVATAGVPGYNVCSARPKEESPRKCKAVLKHKKEEPKDDGVIGVKIINNTSLSDDEVTQIGEELLSKFWNLFDM